MKFLVDAQLPLRLTVFLNQAGHDAVHTGDLPNGNASTDAEIIEIADAHDRVVVTGTYSRVRQGSCSSSPPETSAITRY